MPEQALHQDIRDVSARAQKYNRGGMAELGFAILDEWAERARELEAEKAKEDCGSHIDEFSGRRLREIAEAQETEWRAIAKRAHKLETKLTIHRLALKTEVARRLEAEERTNLRGPIDWPGMPEHRRKCIEANVLLVLDQAHKAEEVDDD